MTRVALAPRTRTVNPGFSRTTPGEIVHIPSTGVQGTPQQPQRLNPQPYRTATPQITTPKPSPDPDIIDAEIIPKNNVAPSRQKSSDPPPKRRQTQPDGNKSAEIKYPDNFPNNPPVDAGFNTVQEWQAWRNGVSRETLAKEAAAYNETKKFPSSGGIISLIPGAWEKVTLPLEEWQNANKYAARHGLPALDRHGNEQAPATHPDTAPARDFQSNPFKQPAPKQSPLTPYTPTENPYNFDNDPETGLPYTESQKRGAKETGRPEWHINPETGRPWNDPLDNPGTPIPLPFNGAPGGGVRFPQPENLPEIAATYTFRAGAGAGFPSHYVPWEASVTLAPNLSLSQSSNSSSGQTTAYIGGRQVATWGDGSTRPLVPNFQIVGYQPVYGPASAAPAPEFTPIGTPAPTPQPQPQPKTQPQPQPQPAPDPRLNPTPTRPTPTNPKPKPTDHPNTTPQPQPQPQPAAKPQPQIPGQPGYNPNGNPSRNPSANPEPARPSQPQPGTGTGTSSDNNTPPKDPVKDICEEPCIKEMKDRQSEVTITIKIFDSCKLDSSGNPDYFKTKQIKCSKSDEEQLKQQFATLAEIQSQQCKKNLAIATVPEWWAVRVGADRPQLVIMFRSTDANASRYTLTIPHYIDDGKKPKIPKYQKGSIKCEVELKDNSKIRIYALNEVEGKRVLSLILKYVNPSMIDSRTPSFKKESRPYKQCEVIPERADYYSTGSKNMEPDARYYL